MGNLAPTYISSVAYSELMEKKNKNAREPLIRWASSHIDPPT